MIGARARIRTSLLVVAVVTAAGACAPEPPVAASELAALYQEAMPLPEYVASMEEHRAEWDSINRRAMLPAGIEARLDSLDPREPVEHRKSSPVSTSSPRPESGDAAASLPAAVLVIATDWCIDSRHNVPYVARIARAFHDLPVRVIDPISAARVLQTYRTPDGRGATPTVLLLDGQSREVGCWIERPRALQRIHGERVDGADSDSLHQILETWYRQDRGAETMRELTSVMEAAFAGRRLCAAG